VGMDHLERLGLAGGHHPVPGDSQESGQDATGPEGPRWVTGEVAATHPGPQFGWLRAPTLPRPGASFSAFRTTGRDRRQPAFYRFPPDAFQQARWQVKLRL
jgi:hypothetical protein